MSNYRRQFELVRGLKAIVEPSYKKLNSIYIPGQSLSLHACIWYTSPSQLRPPWFGKGELHCRLRSCIPRLHVFEQGDHFLQALSPPSTIWQVKTLLNILRGSWYDYLVGIVVFQSELLIKRGWELMKVATIARVWLPTLIHSHQLWTGSNFDESWSEFLQVCPVITNSHATLVLVWPGHESWENSHANSHFSTLINSHVTLVLVWPGHESWENCHENSRFSTIINFKFRITVH